MKQKVALYEILSGEDRWQYLCEATDYKENDESYIRISNIVEVEFEMIDDALIVPKKIQKLREERADAIAIFDEKISKLMAIPHMLSAAFEGLDGSVVDDEDETPLPDAKPFLDTDRE